MLIKFLTGFIVFLIFVTALLVKPVLAESANEYYNEANFALISGNFVEAAKSYNLAVIKNPKLSEAYIGLGIAYRELGNYQKAYETTLKSINLKPNYYQAYYNLGLILEKQNKPVEAIVAYEKFLKEVPGAERFSDVTQKIAKLKKIIGNNE